VLELDTGAPIPGVFIFPVVTGCNGCFGAAVTSDANGAYSLHIDLGTSLQTGAPLSTGEVDVTANAGNGMPSDLFYWDADGFGTPYFAQARPHVSVTAGVASTVDVHCCAGASGPWRARAG
jgi:hypothetical protein